MDTKHVKIIQKLNGEKTELYPVNLNQIEETNVVAMQTLDIAVKDDRALCRPPIEVLKSADGITQTKTNTFNQEDATKYIIDGEIANQCPYVTFDGTMKPITQYDISITEPSVLNNGKMCETEEIVFNQYKIIDKIDGLPEAKNNDNEIKQIAFGDNHTLFLLSDGTVKACGSNVSGELGMGTGIEYRVPTLIPDLANVKQVFAKGSNSIFLLKDGTVKVCGYNYSGELGLGDREKRKVPTVVSDLSNVKYVFMGGSTIFLLDDGTIKMCGYNNNQFGFNETNDYKTVPTLVPGISNIKQIFPGGSLLMWLCEDGTVKVRGYNPNQYFGLARNISEATLIPDLSNVKQFSVGSQTTGAENKLTFLFLLNDGTVKACGNNANYQLGLGDKVERFTPVSIPDLTNVEQVSVSDDYYISSHSLFLLSDGKVKTCGNNAKGQLGFDYSIDRKKPTLIPNLVDVKQISTGQYASIFLLSNGKAMACGNNVSGKIGFGEDAIVQCPVALIPEFASDVRYLYLKNNQVFAGTNNLIKVSDEFTVLSDSDKETLFLAAESKLAEANEISKLDQAKILIYTKYQLKKENCTMTAIPYNRLVMQKKLMDISEYPKILNVSCDVVDNSKIKIIVTADGNAYKTFRNGIWEDIDHTNLTAVATNGIAITMISNITAKNWSELLDEKVNIGFAYLLDMNDITDPCSIERLNIQVQSQGEWGMAVPGLDYRYKYPNSSTLRLTFLENGDYKINYQK